MLSFGRGVLVGVAGLGLMAGGVGIAQPGAVGLAQANSGEVKPLAFEVATIKPSKSRGWNLGPTPDGYSGMGVSLRQLVREAYGMFDEKLLSGGAAWMDSEKFDVQAKFDASEMAGAKALTYQQRAAMLQILLAERFKLKVHHEVKEFPVFELVVAKGGAKLHEMKAGDVDDKGVGITCLHTSGREGYARMQGCSMAQLADTLRYLAGRSVVDKTGLAGLYDFELPDNSWSRVPDPVGRSIFTVLPEELGLRLEAGKAMLDTVVIDSAEMPSGN